MDCLYPITRYSYLDFCGTLTRSSRLGVSTRGSFFRWCTGNCNALLVLSINGSLPGIGFLHVHDEMMCSDSLTERGVLLS